ncbi:TrkH family potassium uptake protein [Georgenia yuyongxinii]|uniref:TrkH family potassium uptake protein n=1 Tax=Georgenia yuyongxinii TaxID=2589797 RepID=A0A552WPS4_9MICO|nr:TrkH family potassium uptake protein [Georgenia yuyongxinii]TRW44755.1 TrkH family potassium uptake protein [Georgenia yuyongxinii]
MPAARDEGGVVATESLPGAIRVSRDWLDRIARNSPARLALLVFAGIIAVETVLLSLPAATASGERAPFVDALFTATSAVCVTGLVTVDTATYWSGFGQAVILVGIQIGGLGVMTLASILGLAVSRRIGLTQRMLTAVETKTTRLGEVGSLIRAVIIASLVVEGILTLVLVPRFLVHGETIGQAVWHGLFMALSIFNNAGFVVIDGGLTQFVGDWWLGLPIVIGTFIGAIGFPVILNVSRLWRTPGKWSLHAKLTVLTSALLAAGSTVAIGLFEWTNPDTFGRLTFGDKILASLVHGMTPRSSGLSTVDVGQMREATWFLTDALMFVGGGSASTAGGIKVSTLAVLVLAIVAEARGDRDIEAYGRRIGSSTVRLAVSVAFIGSTLVGVATLLLLMLTDLRLDVILFEVISAFATCGLSTGITPELPDGAKYVLTGLMFAGRTGTMTVAAALALRERRRVIRMPNERPIIG